jgi:predicted type IV restriction endonuclease
MKKELTTLLKGLRTDERITFFDETRTKQAMVLRLLHSLGWDIFNVEEVFPDYPVAGEKVDFSLRHDNENKVFIVVRRPSEDLNKFEHVIVALSREASAGIGVLTNGIEWRLFLPLRDDLQGQSKFHTIEILKQEPSDLVKKFISYLSREHVRKGKSEEDGEKVFRSRKKKRYIKDALMGIWNNNITGRDSSILNALASQAEKISGYTPEPEAVVSFLKSILKKGPKMKLDAPAKTPGRKKAVPEGEEAPAKKKRGRKKAGRKPLAAPKVKAVRKTRKRAAGTEKKESYIGKKPTAFTLLGQRMKVKKWKEILTNVCNILARAKGDEFESVLSLTGRKRRYFSRAAEDLKEPRQVKGTDIFVETNFNAQNLFMITNKVLESFGFTKSDIQIETR